MTQNILVFSTIGSLILTSAIAQFASALSPNYRKLNKWLINLSFVLIFATVLSLVWICFVLTAREFVTQNITLPDGRQAEIKMVKPAYHYGVWCDGVTITVE